MNEYQKHQERKAELETLIDSERLATVLEMLEEICHEKADHIRANWQDETTARAWMRAAVALNNFAGTKRIQTVSE